MFFTIYYIQVVLHLLIFPQEAGGVPTWTTEPSNPSLAFEGDNITLQWTYSLDTTVRTAEFNDLRGDDDGKLIADKLRTDDPELTDEYKARFRVTASDTEASMTILAVRRSDSGLYQYQVVDNNGDRDRITSDVEILVQYVPEKTNLSSNATDGKVCLDAVVQFTCVSDASPPVHSYLLYKDNEVAGNSSSGVWNINMTAGGNSSYKCQANNTVGSGVSDSISVLVNVPPLISPLNNQTVEEGDTVTLNCDAPGSPEPTVTWTNISSGDRRDGKTWTITNISRADAGEYRCDASNECGNRTRSTFITVHYAPSILDISVNKSVDENDEANLTCTADGIPAPDITWTRVYDNSPVSFNFTITGKQDEGLYRCTANNGVGTPASKDVCITVEKYHPFGTQLHTSLQNDIVELNVMFNVTCSAEAIPSANHRFYMGGESVFNDTSGAGVFPTHVSNRVEKVKYGCIPNNSYGDGPEKTISVTVHYPPNITEPQTGIIEVEAGSPKTITCTADGNPEPSISWINATSGATVGSDGILSFNPATESDSGFTYICTADNGIEPAASFNISLLVGNNSITFEMTFPNETFDSALLNPSSSDYQTFATRIKVGLRMIREISDTVMGIEVLKLREGSVIAKVLLKFKQIVHIGNVISAIRDAAENGSIGDLEVDPKSIALVQEPDTTSTPTTTPAATPKTAPKEETSDFTVLIVVIVVGVGTGTIVIVVVVWHVHKKRKCRRKRVHSENEAQQLEEFSNGENAKNAYSQGNHGYAKSGPAPTSENNQVAAGASAVPTVTYVAVNKSKKNEKPPEHSVVDKSKKKKKSEANEEKPPEDQYAVVNKSQKKKKPKEPEQQYAQVDRSMKKKHAKPGEVLYADLGEFHGNNSLPKVATSPELLPPIKKPPAHVETQYADITQFLKGDATLPPSDGTGGVTSAAATPPGEEAGGGSSHVSKL